MGSHLDKQREGAVVELHHYALECLLRAVHGYFEQLQDDRLILAQHFARSDAKQKGVADLACGAGNGYANGLFAHGENSRK